MRMKKIVIYLGGIMFLLSVSMAWARSERESTPVDQIAQVDAAPAAARDPVLDNARTMIAEGRRTFRYDTFGDEAFWGDTLQLHQAIQGARFGGVGPGVSPKAALAVG